MHRTGWLLVVSLVLVSLAGAEEPMVEKVAEPPAVDISKLIDKLADQDFKVREAAAAAIELRGAEALPMLRRARRHPDPEVRRRLEAWIPALERAGLLAPKRVSLHVNNKSLKDAVKELSRQSGYKIEVYNNGNDDDQLVSLDFDNLTLWEGLDRVATAASAVIQHGYGDETIRLHQNDHHVPFVQHQGVFRIVAQGLHLGRNVNFGTVPNTPGPDDANANSDTMSFSFNVSTEPRLPLLGAGGVRVTRAEDDRGASLVPPQNDNHGFRRHRVHYWGGHRSSSLSLNAQLTGPGKDARHIKIIEGSVPVTLLVAAKKIEVTDDIAAAKGKKLKAGNMNVHVVDFEEKPNQRFEIKLDFVPDGDAGDSWSHTLYNRVEVFDAKGNKLQLYGSSMSQNGKSVQVGFTYGSNGNLGKPAKLVYHDWTTMQHEVRFSFRKLPMP